MLKTAIPQTPLEVFDLLPEGTRIQLINNTLIMSPAPSINHQRFVGSIFNQIYNWNSITKQGEVFTAPIDVQLNYEQIFQPDIIFISNNNKKIITSKRIIGAPDLVIEVLSPGNAGYDKHEKFFAYQQYGVKEYCIVNTLIPSATIYRRDKRGFLVAVIPETEVMNFDTLKNFRILLNDI